ncbi:hypothetical protein SAMN05216226_10975 [Halovenus aranensis]|jgi:hypothetical protein|uniref:Uncharacterized protein n=1 Tax=Halovenus aranensis TaxID=890420 RepID=A0A1G8WKY2_9EURY|nr:hypothetical protein [Halovenus aranensis]SDJ78777.1 hypothetical protein SAMN05216226_10975 [Halovenus aranensis]
MSGVDADLRDAFESEGYDVADVTRNRRQLRIEILDDEASAEQLRAITHEVVDEADVLGLDVSTESTEGRDAMTTVVSFRYRS